MRRVLGGLAVGAVTMWLGSPAQAASVPRGVRITVVGHPGPALPHPVQSWPDRLPASDGAAATGDVVQVVAVGFRFVTGEDYVTYQAGMGVPAPQLHVRQGSTLQFVNFDVTPHTLTSDGCAEGAGFVDPQPPDPTGTGVTGDLAETFDETIGPAVFGDPVTTTTGPCLFDSRGSDPNHFTNAGDGGTTVDTGALAPGAYAFHCVLHEFMQGTLHVDPS